MYKIFENGCVRFSGTLVQCVELAMSLLGVAGVGQIFVGKEL